MAAKPTDDVAWAVWATAWGPVGAVAGPHGLRRFVLPHYPPDQLAELLAWDHPRAARDDEPFRDLIPLTRDYFNARPADFRGVACELPGPGTFAGKVLRACREIPYGRTRSYVALADQAGNPDAARAAARVLGRNRIPLIVPCHRVIYADGRPGGFSADGGPALKARMLALERGE